ncbi:hypothetical protein JQ596_24125 [Bradyrhizobium manausense]|uniref:hypothetical protein n=1 Tax=Bradyrhizobium manausense TaxID=989370 RepID=UPI001BA841E8|nr:hypothetical protein [Bradyrhizobium manausense]MBR0828628.1 hypothetical protein [Bradyrhizobium manausense]
MPECRDESSVAHRQGSGVPDAVCAEDARIRRVLVPGNCGQIVSIEVPFGSTDQQILAEFAKGQLVALASLAAAMLLLFVLIFVR